MDKTARLFLFVCTYALYSNAMEPIHQAACQGNIPMLRSELGNGVHVDMESNRMRTALSYAAENGESDAAVLLLLHGADPAKQDFLKRSSIEYAYDASHTQLVSMLHVVSLINAQSLDPHIRKNLIQEHIEKCFLKHGKEAYRLFAKQYAISSLIRVRERGDNPWLARR